MSVTANTDFSKHLEERMGTMYGTILSSSSCVVDWQNELVSFIMYSPTGKMAGIETYNWREDKTKNNEGRYKKVVSLKSVPWGIEFKRNTPIIIVTEGIFDCIRCLEAGFDSYPLLTFTNRDVLNTLRLYNTEICYLMDYDCKGIAGIKQNKHAISSYAISDIGADPGSMTASRIQELIAQRKPIIEHNNYGIEFLRHHFSQS